MWKRLEAQIQPTCEGSPEVQGQWTGSDGLLEFPDGGRVLIMLLHRLQDHSFQW